MANANIPKILKVVKLTAQIILENGGETYRVEDTVARISQSFGFTEIDALAFPTGVFITLSKDGTESHTVIKRIHNRTIDLSKVNNANRISRLLTEGKITLDQAIVELQDMANSFSSKKLLPTIASALSSGFFTLLFGGSIFDFAIAAVCGAVIQLIAFFFRGVDMFPFIISLTGGFISAGIAIAATWIFDMGSFDLIITGAIMPLLPGLAMTNAIRDTMRGDLVSGVARGTEAMIVAVGLAVGVGTVLKVWLLLGGGLV